MKLPTHLPSDKKYLIKMIVANLQPIKGVTAIVLGGSYAAGTQHPDSDLDIGIYYSPDAPFAISDIQHVAETAAEGRSVTVTNFYEWGKWVNGGAWIHTPKGKVDFLYRNLNQVQETIANAQQGIVHHDYDQQPSTGFYSVMYLAETKICLPLYDPHAIIDALKHQVEAYPPRLKTRIIHDSLWSAEFSLVHAKNFANQGDIYNVSACLTRVAANLTQALFALNETYFLREKQIDKAINAFRIIPADYMTDLNAILGAAGSSREQLCEKVSAIYGLWEKVVCLTNGDYQPKFNLD